MKKVISVLLAILMVFSVMTVAFAADEPTPEEPQQEETTEGEFNFEDIPLWQIKVGVKVGKIVLKIAKAFVKVAMALGIIDSDDILNVIKDLVSNISGGAVGGEETPVETPTPDTPITA